MAEAPNGLASLSKAREKRPRRTMPPPRHPVQTTMADPSNDGVAVASPVSSSILAVAPLDDKVGSRSTVEPEAVEQASPPPPAGVTAPSQAIPVVGEGRPPRPVTLYLDDDQIEFLEQARIAGLLGHPRLDISKSAVVRLALRRLAEQMSIQAISTYMQAQPTDPTKTGRKRR